MFTLLKFTALDKNISVSFHHAACGKCVRPNTVWLLDTVWGGSNIVDTLS